MCEDFDKAISCFRQAMKTDERHYNAWYGLGAIYHRQEKFDLAEVHFERAAAIHPTSSVLKCNLGIAQYANGKAYQAWILCRKRFDWTRAIRKHAFNAQRSIRRFTDPKTLCRN
jgi:Flp pilus assembly protein TadD